MLDTLKIYEKLKQALEPDAAETIAEVISEAFTHLQESSAEKWFQRLDGEIASIRQILQTIVEQQASAQAASEARFARIETALAELTEAQKRSAEELTRYREASEARFARIEATLAEVAEAQRRNELEIRRLTEEMRETRKQLGGLTATVGYSLENRAYQALPALLARDYGLVVEEQLKRRFIQDKQGQYIEVNIFGQARRNGQTVTIVGESKSQLSKNEVDNFIRRKLSRLQGVYPDLFPVLVTHMITSWDVEEYARNRGIAVYYSYDF